MKHHAVKNIEMVLESAKEAMAEAIDRFNDSQAGSREERMWTVGIVAACDALKSAANAYGNVSGQAQRILPREEPSGGAADE